MEERSSIIAVVNLVLRQDDKILLLQRANTGYGDGSYGMISGHVEKGENFTDALIREALEEAGITLQREHLRVVHIQNKFADE
ncbi:MAG: NUDIX domain-containing protein [bacterium]